MAYTVQSPSGKSYDFDDNVPEADAAYYIRNVAEKQQSWNNTVKQIPQDVRTGVANLNAGIATLADDYVAKPLAGITDTGRKLRNVARSALNIPEEEQPTYQPAPYVQQLKDTAKFEGRIQKLGLDGTPSIMQQGVSGAVISLIDTAPDMLLGAGAMTGLARAGTPIAGAAKSGMESALRTMAGKEAARTYGEQREAGMPVHTATAAAIASGLAEYGPEKWANIRLLDVVSGKVPALRGVMDFLLRNLVGEEATTAMQAINRKLTTNPEMTLQDYLHEAAVTGVSATLGGPLQAGASRAVYSGAGMLARSPQAASDSRVEPSGLIPPERPANADVASPGPIPEALSSEAPEGPVVRDKGKGRLDGGELLIGVEGANEPEAGALPPEMAIELLRDAYKRSQESSFTDTAEDKIRRKAEFQARRAEFEQVLKFNPEARWLLNPADSGMNVAIPPYAQLEQEVDDLATLPEEAIQLRAASRLAAENPDIAGTAALSGAPAFPEDLRQQLGVSPTASKFDMPTTQSDLIGGYSAYEKQMMSGNKVQWASRPELVGKTWDEIRNDVKTDDIVVASDIPLNEDARGQLVQFLQPLKERYLPGVSLVLGSRFIDEKTGKRANIHSAATFLGPNMASIVLPMSYSQGALFDYTVERLGLLGKMFGRTRTATSVRVTDQLDTLLHEFTHLVHLRHYESATPAEKRSLAVAYHADLRAALTENVREALSRLYSPAAAESMLQRYIKEGGNPEAKFDSPEARANLLVWAKANYYFNFSEWMAHKGVKYFVTRQGVTADNAGFFRRWIVKMKELYQNVVLRYIAGAPAFNQWLDNLAITMSGLEGLQTESDIAATRNYLVQAGVHPDLADTITTVRGSDSAYVAAIAETLSAERDTDKFVQNLSAAFGELGSLLGVTQRSKFEKGVKLWTVAQDLLKQPPFNNDRKFNSEHLIDAALSTFINSKRVTTTTISSIRSVTTFKPAGDVSGLPTASAVHGPNYIQIAQSSWRDEPGQRSVVEIGLINHILRDMAKETAPTSVKLLGVSTETLKYFGAEPITGAMEQVIQVPFWAYEQPVKPVRNGGEVPAIDMMLNPSALFAAGKQFGSRFFQSSGNALARFNYVYQKTLGAFNLIKLNEHVPGMVQEREALRNRMAYRHKWLSTANDRVEKWAFKIDKGQSAKISRMLFEEAENGIFYGSPVADPSRPGHYLFPLPAQLRQQRGLTLEAAELYSEIRNDLMRFADEWHKVGLWEVARAHLSQPAHVAVAEAMRKDAQVRDVEAILNVALASVRDPQAVTRVMEQIRELDKQFSAWKAKPYMPYTRFGRYGVVVKDASTGETKYFAGFDSRGEALLESNQLQQRFPSDALSVTYIEDVPYQLAGMPPVLLEAMQSRLQLTNQQKDAFAVVLQQLSHANSFAHRQAHKVGVEGYSKDALRAYSDYFRRGSAYLARVKSEPELNDALNMLQGFMKRQASQAGEVTDIAVLGKLHEYFARLHKYLADPGNEYGELKSMVSLFHFGFNLSTAAINMAQVPLVTLPWLSERYGMPTSMTALKKAYSDVAKVWAGQSPLAADEIAMLDFASQSGFRDESQATVLAQLADGGALARASPSGIMAKGLNTLNHYAMWAFGKGELVNRDVTLLAAYRLSKATGYHGPFDKAAFDFARQSVEETHNEYSQENRPEIMRGAGSVVFQFMHYSLNMLFLTLGGDKSWWRILLAQAAFAGILGLPFAGDLANAAKFVGRRVFGGDWDLEREARLYLKELGTDPDLFLRGLSSNVFGADLSKRMSLGEIIPGMQAVGSHKKFQDALYSGVGDFAGPAASVLTNLLQFVSENDKMSWDAMKRILPTSVKNMGNAAQAFSKGAVTDKSGAVIFEPKTWDIMQMAVGFAPKELNAKYAARNMQQEQAAYWTHRKGVLLDIWGHIVFDRNSDREAVKDFLDRLEDYNAKAPDPRLRITHSTLRNSVKRKAEARMYKEMGLGGNSAMQIPAGQISETWQRDE